LKKGTQVPTNLQRAGEAGSGQRDWVERRPAWNAPQRMGGGGIVRKTKSGGKTRCQKRRPKKNGRRSLAGKENVKSKETVALATIKSTFPSLEENIRTDGVRVIQTRVSMRGTEIK